MRRRTMADVDADWEADNQRLDYLGQVIDEMLVDAEIDTFHRNRSTTDERLAYIADLVAHASDHALNQAKRELRLISTSSSTDLKRRVLERPKRPSQIYPTHYQNRSA